MFDENETKNNFQSGLSAVIDMIWRRLHCSISGKNSPVGLAIPALVTAEWRNKVSLWYCFVPASNIIEFVHNKCNKTRQQISVNKMLMIINYHHHHHHHHLLAHK